jgi:hypothetical protein
LELQITGNLLSEVSFQVDGGSPDWNPSEDCAC